MVILVADANLTALSGQVSQACNLYFRFGKMSNGYNYSIQAAGDVVGPWADYGLSTKYKVTLEDLTPLRPAGLAPERNGAAGFSDWIEPTCKIVV